MLSETLTAALVKQLNNEMGSAYLYLSMSAYAEDAGLKGAATWLYAQSREEMAHAIHMYQYIMDRGSKPALLALEAPAASFSGMGDIFNKVLASERATTKNLNDIATLAMKENDHACYQFIMWYVNEQVEEEASASDIIAKLDMIGDNKGLLLSLDKELGTRVYANPFPADEKLN
ncbi:MAG: ferritin [Treponema sp.]|nr:ferritin [Treponema sp.]